MKTITANGKTFNAAVYPIETEPSLISKRFAVNGIMRESIRVTVASEYADVKDAFVNGVLWSINEISYDADSGEVITAYDKAEYSVAGDIIDHRDGRITVYMAKPTEAEKVRSEVELILPSLDDGVAVTVPTLFPEWKAGVSYTSGERVFFDGALWRVLISHTSQSEWTPSAAVSLFEKVK